MHRLPKEIIYSILQYDNRFKIRKGKLHTVVPDDDPRREVLQTIPMIDRFGHVWLTDTDKYELHLISTTSEKDVRWTMYKYFKDIDEEEVMDGVVFSMVRCSEKLLT